MQRLLLVAWILATTGTVIAPQPARANHYTDEQVIQAIYNAAAEYGQDPGAMERVARCESQLNEHAYSPRGEMGIFQFHPGTWAQTPFAGTDPYDPVNNARAAGWMWLNGRKGEWVCQ